MRMRRHSRSSMSRKNGVVGFEPARPIKPPLQPPGQLNGLLVVVCEDGWVLLEWVVGGDLPPRFGLGYKEKVSKN